MEGSKPASVKHCSVQKATSSESHTVSEAYRKPMRRVFSH